MRERRLCSICLIFLIVQALFVFVTGGQTFQKVPAASIFYDMEGSREILLQGQVYKKAEHAKNQVLYLKNNSITYRNKSFQESNLMIYYNMKEEISIGQTVRLRGQLNRFESARNPGNFDQSLYYAKQNIRGFVWCEEIVCVSGEKEILDETLYLFRKAWKNIILENMGEDSGGVLSAMLLGEKSAMDVETKELYQKIGISHVLAVSGLHISFIGLGIYSFFRKLGRSYFIAGFFAAAVLTCYVIMIGFSVSVIRAYVMLLFRILADVTGRIYDILTALAFSAVITVFAQPLCLMEAGFYLSYGAICGIVFVKPQIEKLFCLKNKMILESMTSVSINLTLFPILLWFYYEFPVYSVIINVLVIPLMSLVLGMGIFGSFGILVCRPIGKICFVIVDVILQFYEWMGTVGSRLPFSTIILGKPKAYQMFLYYIVLVAVLFFLAVCKNEELLKKSRKYVVVTFVLLMTLFVKIPNGRLCVTFLDVGQGDCIFLKGPRGNTYLVDGGSSDVGQVGKYRIEPFLKSQGIGVLDYVFVSHGDRDHYSGILELLERQKTGIKIRYLVFPENYQKDKELLQLLESAKNQGIQAVVLKAGQKISEGEMDIICLQPGDTEGYLEGNLEGNAGSMVLSISFQEFDFLCTGDVEGSGEEILCKKLEGRSYDVLKVAHHGSKNSTTEYFLEIVRPYISIISAGKDNMYGHPHKETLDKLKQCRSRIYQTSENGAITIESDGEFIDIFNTCH